MRAGEQSVVDPGRAPAKTAMLNAINIIQWAIYYPGILAPDELGLSADEQQALAASLAAYRSGDLLAAAAEYPTNRAETSDAQRVYHAAILLAVGQAEQSGNLLEQVKGDKSSDNSARLAVALRELLAVVKNQEPLRPTSPMLASEFMAESYYFQAQARLSEALDTARRATEKA